MVDKEHLYKVSVMHPKIYMTKESYGYQIAVMFDGHVLFDRIEHDRDRAILLFETIEDIIDRFSGKGIQLKDGKEYPVIGLYIIEHVGEFKVK